MPLRFNSIIILFQNKYLRCAIKRKRIIKDIAFEDIVLDNTLEIDDRMFLLEEIHGYPGDEIHELIKVAKKDD